MLTSQPVQPVSELESPGPVRDSVSKNKIDKVDSNTNTHTHRVRPYALPLKALKD